MVDINKYEKFHQNKSDIKFKLQEHPVKGRILVATEKILAGEVIFGEEPLIFGPVRKPNALICLNCLKQAKKDLKCSNCFYPMCSESCKESHLNTEECKIISLEDNKENRKQLKYEAILPLRCMIMKNQRPNDWEYFKTFQSHIKEYKNSDEWDSSIIKQIREVWKQSEYSVEDIEMVEGIIFVNGLELPVKDDEISGRAFYPITSFCSHDCVNNTLSKKQIQKDKIYYQLLAKIDIQKGDEITLHYACGFKGRKHRRNLLKEGWFFDCGCDRCRSPTELESHMSTVRICRCRNNSDVLPFIDNDLNLVQYQCKECKRKFDSEEVDCFENELIKQIESTYTSDIERFEMLLSEYGSQFHPRHYLVLILKWFLINLYGRKKGFMNHELSPKRLKSKINYCRDYLQMLNIVDPGISHNRGKTLWEYYSVKVYCLQNSFTNGKITKEQFLKGLNEMENTLSEVQYCLYHYANSENSFEEKIFQLSKKASVSIKETKAIIALL